jgi:hypothetical protein
MIGRLFIALTITMLAILPGYASAQQVSSTRGPITWNHIGVGSRIYLGSDNKPLGDTAQAVCPSPIAYRKFTISGRLGTCRAVAHGTPAVVVGFVSRFNCCRPHMGYDMAYLRSVDHSWRGYAAILLLQPEIRIGTILQMEGEFGIAPPRLAATSSASRSLALAKGTRVRVLKYEPRLAVRTLYVRVLDGKYRGQNGWVYTREAQNNVLGYYGCCTF